MIKEATSLPPSISASEHSFMGQTFEFAPEDIFQPHMSNMPTSMFLCFADCTSSQTILCHKEFFLHIKEQAPFHIKTIAGRKRPCHYPTLKP